MNDQIIQRDVETLIPYARNARIHTNAQVAQIAASIQEFGFCNPILIHGNQIVAGHGRLLAARKLGMATVPTLDLSHLTKTPARA
jgi:ParB-like chromosome segregation protein Spo0J